MKSNKILKVTAYVTFGIITFVLFTFLNFPYHKLQDKIFLQIENQTGLIIDVEEFKTTLLLGVKLSQVTLSHKNIDLPPIRIPELSARPSISSLIFLRPKIKFKISFLEGSAYGTIQKNYFSLTMSDLNIKKQFKDYLPINLDGIINGSIEISGNFQKTQTLEGLMHVAIQKFVLDKTNVMNMEIPQISLSNVILNTTLKRERLNIDQFDVGSDKDDLKAQITGDILTNPRRFNDSRLNLKLKLKLSEKFKKDFQLFLPFIANSLGPDGFYSLNITGTLAAPLALPQKS